MEEVKEKEQVPCFYFILDLLLLLALYTAVQEVKKKLQERQMKELRATGLRIAKLYKEVGKSLAGA